MPPHRLRRAFAPRQRAREHRLPAQPAPQFLRQHPGSRPQVRIVHHRPHTHHLQVCAPLHIPSHPRQPPRCFLHQSPHVFQVRLPAVLHREFARQQFKEHHPQRIHIRLFRQQATVPSLLRRHIAHRAHDRPRERAARLLNAARVQQRRDAKIQHHRIPVRADHHIRRLHIPVRHAPPVRIPHRHRHLPHHLHSLPVCDPRLPLPILERHPLHQPHHQPRTPPDHPELHQLRNVRPLPVARQQPQRLRLLLQPCRQPRALLFIRQRHRLQHHLPTRRQMPAPPHLTHPPLHQRTDKIPIRLQTSALITSPRALLPAKNPCRPRQPRPAVPLPASPRWQVRTHSAASGFIPHSWHK